MLSHQLSGPLDLVHARGLAAVIKELDASKVQWQQITVHVPDGAKNTKIITIDDPVGVAAEADATFRDLVEDAVRAAAQRANNPSLGWRIAGAVGSATKEAALTAFDWVADRTPSQVREGVMATGAWAKESALAAGRLASAGVQAAARRASKYGAVRELIQRIDNAEMVATRVIVEVVAHDGTAQCYAPWVVDPIATLRNEHTQAAINGALTVVGWGPVHPVAAATFAAGFTIWGFFTADPAQSRARSNMGLAQFMQAVAAIVPFAGVYTLPAATAKDLAEARALSEGMKNGDPFVAFWPGRLVGEPDTTQRKVDEDTQRA